MTDQFAGKTKAECRTMMRSADISAFFQDIEYTDHAIKAENMRGNTSKAYRSDLIVFASWLAIQCPEQTFRSVTVDDIRNYIAFLQDHRGLRPNTINSYIAAIRKMFHVLRNEELSKRELPDLIVDVYIPKVPSVEQVAMMIHASKTIGTLAYLLIMLLIATGVRFSEALRMRFSDIRKDTMQIYVSAQSKGRNDRMVPMPPDLLNVLTQYCREYNAAHHGTPLTQDDYIFFNEDRTGPMKPYKLRNEFSKIQQVSGLARKGFTPHSCRHYMALQYYLQSHDILLIKHLLGHKSLAATEVYLVLAASIEAQTKYISPLVMALNQAETRKEGDSK